MEKLSRYGIQLPVLRNALADVICHSIDCNAVYITLEFGILRPR